MSISRAVSDPQGKLQGRNAGRCLPLGGRRRPPAPRSERLFSLPPAHGSTDQSAGAHHSHRVRAVAVSSVPPD